MSTFSILLPTYNSERYVANAIESALEQSRAADCEIIIIDDGSTDRTLEIVQKYAGKMVRVYAQSHAGTAAARNAGLRHARGDVIVLLDHDDELHPRFVEEAEAVLESDPRVAIVFTDAYVYEEDPDRLLPETLLQLRPLPKALDLPSLIRGNFVSARAAIRRDVVLGLGGFDTSLTGGDDFDLWLRVLYAGHEMEVIRKPLAYYRLHRCNFSRDRVETARLGERVLTKALRDFELPPKVRRECEVRIAASTEWMHLALGEEALQRRHLRSAASEYGRAWRVSPLRWRALRILYSAARGVRARSTEAGDVALPPARTMRLLSTHKQGGDELLSRGLLRRARRAVSSHAPVRRGFNIDERYVRGRSSR